MVCWSDTRWKWKNRIWQIFAKFNFWNEWRFSASKKYQNLKTDEFSRSRLNLWFSVRKDRKWKLGRLGKFGREKRFVFSTVQKFRFAENFDCQNYQCPENSDLPKMSFFQRSEPFEMTIPSICRLSQNIFVISLNSDFPASMGLREMIIPNANTIQQNYFLKTLSLDHQLPLLFVGPTGTWSLDLIVLAGC